MTILVLGGGNSPEREVSLRSAKNVAQAAKQAGFNVIEADPAAGLGILDSLLPRTVVFPVLHGAGGEDGSLQAELEERNLPYLGSTSAISANCFDKWKARELLRTAGLKVAEGALVTRNEYIVHPIAQKPHVLKVLKGGSSIGTLIVRQPQNTKPEQIDEIFFMEERPLIEALIDGVEVTVPIFDQRALPSIEIRPPEGAEFDYENKYNGATQELCPPPSLSQDQIIKAGQIGEAAHRALGCRHLSRPDMIMRPDGNFVVLEVNTIPGMTEQSLYPKSAAVAGTSMPELIKNFVELIKRDYSL